MIQWLVLSACMLSVSLVQAWSGDWDVMPTRTPSVDATSADGRCIPVVPRVQRHLRSHHKAPLLRVYVAYSPQIVGMVMNLVESMMTSFPTVDVVDDDEGDAAQYRSQEEHRLSFSQCDAWLRNTSLEHAHYQFRRRPSAAPSSAKGQAVDMDASSPPPVFPFSGLCFGIHELSTTAGSVDSSGKRGDWEQTAAFGSAPYYDFLEKKLHYFAHQLTSNSSGHGGFLYSRWALFLDADVQVFPGFFSIVAAKTLCPYFTLQCAHTNYLGSCTPHFPLPPPALSDDGPVSTMIHIYFQRETRKLVNTGLVLVDTSASGTRCLYSEASRLVQHAKYGDQTAIQRALKRLRGFCVATGRDARGSVAQPSEPSTSIYPLVHSVFHRLQVNGNVLNRSLLVAHHAHMSGSGKQSALWRAVLAMQQEGATQKRSDGAVVHSGAFLRGAADAFLSPRSVSARKDNNDRLVAAAGWRAMCAKARPTNTVVAVCALLKASMAASVVSVGSGNVGPSVSPSRRHLMQLVHSAGGSGTSSSSHGATMAERVAKNSFAMDPATTAPTGSTPSLRSVDNINSSNASAIARANRKLKKSKALWTALPALVVIITLTIFHCYIANPTQPQEGDVNDDAPDHHRRSTHAEGGANDVEMEVRVDVSGITERSRMV